MIGTTHFNQLSEAEAELLALLLEEMGEAQHTIGKILRHGYESHNPFEPEAGTNREMLQKEMGHVLAALELLVCRNDLSDDEVNDAKFVKLRDVPEWLHHQDEAQ